MPGPATYRLLPHNELLHLLHLRHVVLVGLQLPLADPLIDPDKHLPRDVLTVIHTWEGTRASGQIGTWVAVAAQPRSSLTL